MNIHHQFIMPQSLKCIWTSIVLYFIISLPAVFFNVENYFIIGIFILLAYCCSIIFFYPFNKYTFTKSYDRKQFLIAIIANAIFSNLLVYLLGMVWFMFFISNDYLKIQKILISPFGLFPLAGLLAAGLGVLFHKKNIIKNFSNYKF